MNSAKPDHQDPAAAEQIRGAAAEQQEAAERERVRGHDPLQAGLGEVQIAADRRQRDVDDRQIDDRHEERHRQQRERAPAIDMSVMWTSLDLQWSGCETTGRFGAHRTSQHQDDLDSRGEQPETVRSRAAAVSAR